MKRCLSPLALLLMIALTAGCNNSLGDDNDSSTVTPPKPKEVSEQERAAIDTLQERGAEIDLDDGGHVRIVDLVKTKATNDDLKLLQHFPYLESLDVTGGKITESGLPHLKELKGLQRLYINDLPIKSAALANLSTLTKLDVLSLRNTKINDEGMVHLKKLKQLTVLNLSKTAITNDALKEIQGLKQLDTLVLADTAATGKGFGHLRSMKNLRTLNVDRCKDIDGHLLKLSGLSEMRMLYVHGCITSPDEVEELTDRNPRLAVFGD